MKLCLGCMELYDDEYDVCTHCGYIEGTEAEEAYHMQPGSLLQDRYIVGRVLGYGGFGVTYIGWDKEMERKVAIKEYLPSEFSTRMPESTQVTVFSGDKEEQFQSGLDKFVDEARRLAKFHSSNGIIHIFDSFKENNTAYIIMEYLEGETLKERLQREGKLEIEEALSIILPILYSLRDVHEMGIIHRDIAPDNIYLTNEKDENGNPIVKLLDFGAARFSTTRHSKSLSVLVKAGYSPEEQYRSRGDQGTWTDVYAVSATLYRMITGVIPQDSIERSLKDEVKSPSKLGIKINKSLENAILNGMNIKIENRTQTVDVLIEELESEQTKRRKEKIRKVDIGKWPLWLKITSGSLATVVAACIILLATGIIKFNILGFGASSVPEGMTRVPNVINLTVSKAEEQAKSAGLEFQILEKQYSNEVGIGKILKQNHLGGSLVDLVNEETDVKGTLAVTISAGEEMTYVPDVVNFTAEIASQQIQNANLIMTSKEEAGDDAPGTVASQSLEPDTEVAVGTNVDLVISTGRGFDSSVDTTVPNLIGLDYNEAKATMLDKCLYIAKAEVRASDDAPKGQIIEQSLEEGTTIAQNSTVMVVVSGGQEMTFVPDVQYKLQEEATQLLQDKKLKVVVKEQDSDIVQKGRVISQSVESGENVKVGTEVVIYISKGNKKADNTITTNDIVITQDIQVEQEKAKPIIEINLPTNKPANNTTTDTKKEETNKKDESDKKEEQLVVDTRVTVPNVVGQSQDNASNSIASAGLIAIKAQSFSESVAEGNVISQSIANGNKVEPNTTVVIVISKGHEAPSGWTTDASFTNNPYYNVQVKTQYRKQTRTRETTTSSNASLSGWTRDDSKTVSNWGNWSGWTTTSISANENRQVDTRTITDKQAWTDKVYYYWKSNTSLDFLSEHRNGYDEYKEVRESDFTAGTMYFWTNFYSGLPGYVYGIESTRTILGVYYASELWAYKGTEYHPAVTHNEYRYRDKYYTYYFWKYTDWSSWSDWQDSAISGNDTVNVETRTVYLYTAK